MLPTPLHIGAALFLVNHTSVQQPSSTASFPLQGSVHAAPYLVGTQGVVALTAEQEGSRVWTDFMSVGAYDEALAHLQDQLLVLRFSQASMVWDRQSSLEFGGDLSSQEGRAPTKEHVLQAAQGAVRIAQAGAARCRGVHAGLSTMQDPAFYTDTTVYILEVDFVVS